MNNNNINKILLIFLAINLVLTCVLTVALITTTGKLQQQQDKISQQIDAIEPYEDSGDSLAVMGGIFMSELEGKVDEITADIKSEIAGVEDSFSKYDEDIKSISESLVELNEKMENVNKVMLSLQEILDSINNFFKIG